MVVRPGPSWCARVRWQRQRQTVLLERGLGAAELGEGVVAAVEVGSGSSDCRCARQVGISLGSEVENVAAANLIWPHRLAASSIEWMTMWAGIRAEWAAAHHADDRTAESKTVWERGWRTISGDIFRVIDAVVTRIVASSLDMPSEAAVRMLFTPVPLTGGRKALQRRAAGKARRKMKSSSVD